jgi:hypothetical protein
VSTEFISNAEYFERWEQSAPTPIDSVAEAKRTGKTWNEEMDFDPTMTAELAKQIEEYALNVHDDSSNQTKEELARQQELNADVAKDYQFVAPTEYNDAAERTGIVMHASTFLKKLQSIGLNCWYANHPQAGKVTLIYINELTKKPEVGCWLQPGNMPELSLMNFDDHGVPLAEAYRGWRTGLLQLILKSAITEKDADRVFGRPKTTRSFHRYNMTLQSFRNAGSRLEESNV